MTSLLLTYKVNTAEQLNPFPKKEPLVRKTARLTVRSLFFMFFISSLLTLSAFAFQMMQGTGRGKTAGPAVTKVTPKRAKTVHKATPKSLLVVKKISITPANPHVGDKVAIHALVANNGPEAVKGVKIAFYLGRKQVAWQVYDIKAKSSQDYRGFFTQAQAPKAGTYTVRALVDPNRTLERTSYKCNSAVLKITLHSPVVRKRPGTALIKGKTTPQSGTRHTGNKGTPSGNPEVKTPERVPTRRIAPMPPGQIHTITVKVLTRSRTPSSRTRRGENIHALEIRWARKGTLPGRVDIFLHLYRRSGKGLCLRRNAANNGRATLPVPGKAKTGQRYIVRIQTHDGKIHGDSKSFSLSPETPVKTGGHPQTVTSARRAKGGGVAATPISIPRTVDASAHKKTPHAKQVKLDPGIGPNRARINSAAAIKKRITLPGKMTTYGPQPGSPPGGGTWETITSPKGNNRWERGKTYRIMWEPSGVKVTKVAWTNAATKASHDIFSSTTTPITTGYMDWAIPGTLVTGNYVITITVGATSVKSGKFSVTPSSFMKAGFQKANPAGPANSWKNHIPDNKHAGAPRITYFDYTLVDLDKQKNYILKLQFYWEDTDLYGGKWTFEYNYGKLGKKTGALASLPHGNDFREPKGMTMIEIPFDKKSSMGKSLPIAFYLTDAKGVTGNVVKKTVAFPGSLSALPPAKLIASGPITFVSPSHPGIYVKGTKVDIQLSLSAKLKAQNPVIKIELVPASKKGSSSVIYNKTLPKDGRVSWTIPESIAEGAYHLRASSAKEYTTSESFLRILDKGITVTSPKEGSRYQVGDTVLIQWKAKGLPENETMNIYFGGSNNKLNKTPVPIKSGSWSWKIKPGFFCTGGHYLEFEQSQTNDFLTRVSVIITYPKNVTPPSMVFTKPSAGQATRWMAGTSQEVEWGASGEFSEAVQLRIYLDLRDKNKPFIQCKIGDIKISAGTHSGLLHKTKVKIPTDLPSGPYQMTSVVVTGGASGGAGKVLGKGPVVEVLRSGYMDSMIPDSKTTFKITGVEYPKVGGPMTVHVQVNSPKPFRITSMGNQNWGTQYLAYRISNYVFGQNPEVAVNDDVSVKENPSFFPNHVFPSGVSVYSLVFTPKLIKPVNVFTTLQDMVTNPFSAGAICWHHYLPKLEIYLDTFLQGSRRSSEYKKIYLNDDGIKGIGRKSHKFSGKINSCSGALYVEW